MAEEDEMGEEDDKGDMRRDISGGESAPKGECGYIRRGRRAMQGDMLWSPKPAVAMRKMN